MSREGVSLLIRNLPLDVRSEDLREKFERYGKIRDVYIPRDFHSKKIVNGCKLLFASVTWPSVQPSYLPLLTFAHSYRRPKGFAFVEYYDRRDADDAQYKLDRTPLLGREMTVVFARERRKTPNEMRDRDRSPSPRGRRDRGRRYSDDDERRNRGHGRRDRSPDPREDRGRDRDYESRRGSRGHESRRDDRDYESRRGARDYQSRRDDRDFEERRRSDHDGDDRRSDDERNNREEERGALDYPEDRETRAREEDERAEEREE